MLFAVVHWPARPASYRGFQIGRGSQTAVVITLAIVLIYTDSHKTMANLVSTVQISA